MIGRDEKMLVVFEWIRTAAKSDISVLILCPTGSGKEVVARMIHELSRRGTNKWQGSGFGFYQNNDAIARNAFQTVVPNFGRQQLGFNLRGPLAKDRLFIATSYELTSTDFFFDVNPTSGANWTQFRGSYAAPNRNHTAFTRLTYVQNPRITYDAMASARFLRGEGFPLVEFFV